MEQSLKQSISYALEEILNGKLDDKRIRELMLIIPKNEYKSLGAEALHQAMHFISDQDLRSKDKEYDEYLKEELRCYIDNLQRVPGSSG